MSADEKFNSLLDRLKGAYPIGVDDTMRLSLPLVPAGYLLVNDGEKAMARRGLRHFIILTVVALLGAIQSVVAQGEDELAALRNQVGKLHSQGKDAEAEPLAQRYVDVARKKHGEEHAEYALAVSLLALVDAAQGRYSEAEPLMKRGLAIREKTLGPDDPLVATSLNDLAVLYRALGRYAEAEPLYKRALDIRKKAFGSNHRDVGQSLNDLALLYFTQGRYTQAEPLYKRALSIFEKVLPSDDTAIGGALNNLALLYRAQGKFAEAEPLYKRAISIFEKALGPDHRDVGQVINNLAVLYHTQHRYAEAEPLYRRALAIREKALGPDHPLVATSLNNLAALCRAEGRYAEAEPFYKRALAITEKALGPDHPDVGIRLNNLALLYSVQGRYAEAEPLYQRALAVTEAALGPDHPDVGTRLNNLAELAMAQRQWGRAVDYWRRSTVVSIRRAERGFASVGQTLTGRRKSQAEQRSSEFVRLVKMGYRLASEERGAEASLAREMFQAAQWAHASQAAASLAQMAVRGASENPNLAGIVRERQDLVAEWQRRDGLRSAAVAKAPDKRDRAAEAANLSRLASIDARIADIDRRLAADFPDYAALAKPGAMTVAEVQRFLRANEALVLVLDTPEAKPTSEETFIWVVTRTDLRWVRSDLGTKALTREVAALRCGLDATSWADATNWSEATEKLARERTAQIERRHQCEALLNAKPQIELFGVLPVQVLPFDHARAYTLYRALFGAVEDLIKDKDLLIVPSGPLAQLPFQVLITAPPANRQNDKSAAWLIRSHALTVLPATASLKALRRVARPSVATKPIIGFGNPLLDGDQSDPQYGTYYKGLAALARERQSCPVVERQDVASLRGVRGGIAPLVTRNGLAELAELEAQTPLPETAVELCSVARDLGGDAHEMRLGARATESEIKALSRSGTLAKFRIVHFATHGTLAGQLSGTTEPGLILTPPAQASQEDDGYLTASEITTLKLDAEWVILSACNTAAAGGNSVEALSGLARAFFYAQARALLVSQWEVNSAATVKLITMAADEIARNKSVGRAEALRRSMLALIDKGQPYEAHPAYWAPFMVVGEGAASR